MSDVPRRLPRTKEQRLEQMVSNYMVGSMMGKTEYAAPMGEKTSMDKDEYPRIYFTATPPENARVGDFYIDPADLV